MTGEFHHVVSTDVILIRPNADFIFIRLHHHHLLIRHF